MPIMKKINFIHCVCTAGGDFTWYLQKQFPPSNMLCAPDVESSIHLNSPRKRMHARISCLIHQYQSRVKRGDEVRFIYGHSPLLENFEDIFGDGFYHIALLRDPVRRFISQHRISINENNTLDKFIEWERGFKSREGDDPEQHNGLSYSHQTEFMSGSRNIIVDDSDLRLAKENLEKCAFVGIAERFDDSVQLFSKIFSIPYMRFNPLKKYKTKSVKEIDAGIVEYIREKSKFDLELYEFGKDLFEKRYSEFRAVKLLHPGKLERFLIYPTRELQLLYVKAIAKIRNNIFHENVVY